MMVAVNDMTAGLLKHTGDMWQPGLDPQYWNQYSRKDESLNGCFKYCTLLKPRMTAKPDAGAALVERNLKNSKTERKLRR
jgi:hypothetical protein